MNHPSGKQLIANDRGQLFITSREVFDDGTAAYVLLRVKTEFIEAYKHRYEATAAGGRAAMAGAMRAVFLLLPGVSGWEVVDVSGDLPPVPLLKSSGALPSSAPAARVAVTSGPTPPISAIDKEDETAA